MMPWERDLYFQMLLELLEKQKEARENNKG